jgi:hypothetical protein
MRFLAFYPSDSAISIFFFIDPVTKSPQFAEQAAGYHKCAEIGVTNVHILLKSQLDKANVLQKSCDKTSTVC